MKRIIALLLCICMLVPLCSCEGETDGADAAMEEFLLAFSEQHFDEVYGYFWEHTTSITKEDFVKKAEYVMSVMEVTGIRIKNKEISEEGGNRVLSYTVEYSTKQMGDISFDVSLIMVDDMGCHVKYKPEMLLEGYQDGDRISLVTTEGKRGEIYTADGVCIAANDYADTVYLDMSQEFDINDTLSKLEGLLGLEESRAKTIKAQYKSAQDNNYAVVVVKALKKGSTEGDLGESLKAIAGVDIDTTSMTTQRYYPYGEIYSHITGYTSVPSESEEKALREAGFENVTQVGKDGLEKSFDLRLQGKNGLRLQLSTQDGQFKKTLAQIDAVDGDDLVLSIESELQERAYYYINGQLSDTQTGAAIVLDAKTGFVQAMVNHPTFDANDFIGGISSEKYAELTDEDGQLPLFNRATHGLYAPGSLFKPLSIVPALEEGVVTKSKVFPYKVTKNQWKPDDPKWVWPAITRDSEPDGPLDLEMAMKKSDNIYFSWAALLLGQEKFMAYMKKLGLGEEFVFDLPVSKSNLLNEGTELNDKIMTDMSFGHGEILITPIQMASYYTLFQNNGDSLQPRLVKEIYGYSDKIYKMKENFSRTVYKEDLMKKSTIDILIPTLEDVVTSGTAEKMKITGRTLAAKTGTALKGKDKSEKLSWVTGWWQGYDESRLVTVMIDSPRDEEDNKLTIAKALLRS